MLCHMRRASVFYSPRQRASGARVNAGPAAPTRISSRCIGNIGGLNVGWSRSSLARPARWSPRAPCNSALILCWQDLRQRSLRGVDACYRLRQRTRLRHPQLRGQEARVLLRFWQAIALVFRQAARRSAGATPGDFPPRRAGAAETLDLSNALVNAVICCQPGGVTAVALVACSLVGSISAQALGQALRKEFTLIVG
jgi:hypothetical protein